MFDRYSNRRGQWFFLVLYMAFLVGVSGPVVASDEHDHDRARQALEAGEVLPLRTILERIEREYPGQVIDVELERKDRRGDVRWVYEIKLLRRGGNLVKLKVDARDGTVIGTKSRGGDVAESDSQKHDLQKNKHRRNGE
ncbi:MAG: hypothetical protein CVU16_14710 [Betaproteobacteria bacterium HGW-Betaproteobacteria-10]|nr:MAG: hypothetical protein CVU16_14710 [Betaproteobacteria bacterium HGW-Betaproteobacteria-10]